jgi:hypothetical protein
MAHALVLVEQRDLGAGVGPSAADDDPCASGPTPVTSSTRNQQVKLVNAYIHALFALARQRPSLARR